MKDGGTTILVPAGEADAARLDVSGADLPLKGTVGFELFNQSDMGLTEFAQKVNYQRALQGEIARTIMAMDGISYARVHLALPERLLFRADSSEASAAVTLTPRPGVQLDPQRVAGIQRLVASAVPELALDRVAILNERGELLTPEFSDSPSRADSESAIEAEYRNRIEQVVARAAPRAHVDVRVTIVPRTGGSAPTAPSGDAPDQLRDYSIRVVLFERSPLTAADVIGAAQTAQDKWNVPASVSIAQWILESGFGKHMPPGSNNPFGIKAAKGQPSVMAWTNEQLKDGSTIRIKAPFRKFDSLDDAFDAHGRLLATGKAYASARQYVDDPNAYANALTGHYATDHLYGSKLITQMRRYDLYRYDH